jgi:hypothetical protein
VSARLSGRGWKRAIFKRDSTGLNYSAFTRCIETIRADGLPLLDAISTSTL